MRRIMVAIALLLAACSSGNGSSDAPSLQSAPSEHHSFTSADAIAVFRRAGLELGVTRPLTIQDYGLAPHVATEGTRFLIPSLGEDLGGRVMSFANQADLDVTKKYFDDLGRGSAALYSWTFAEDNLLVQINGDLPEPKARAYEAALRSLG